MAHLDGEPGRGSHRDRRARGHRDRRARGLGRGRLVDAERRKLERRAWAVRADQQQVTARELLGHALELVCWQPALVSQEARSVPAIVDAMSEENGCQPPEGSAMIPECE